MTRPTPFDAVMRLVAEHEQRCAERGHYWAEFSPSEQYCQACGLRRPHAKESA
jgi:uncharacterized protein (DUF983 family)